MANKVINFHDIYNKDWFEQTLLILKSKYSIISIQELDDYFYKAKRLQNSCLITVDDGDRTFYEVMYPVLLKLQLPAILFVSPKIITTKENFWFQEIRHFDKIRLNKIISDYYHTDLQAYSNGNILKNCNIHDIWEIIRTYKELTNHQETKTYNMSVEQLKEVHNSKIVTIGAHTQNHPILKNEEDEKSKSEIQDSIDTLETLLQDKIYYFAYPNGTPGVDYTQREMSFLQEKGIRLAFSTKSDNFSLNYNTLEVPRFGLSYGSANFVKIKLFLGKYWDVIKNIKSPDESSQRKEIKTKMQNAAKQN